MELSKEFLEKQKELLVKEKEQLEEKIKTLKMFPDYGWDPESNIQETIDYESNLPFEIELTKIVDKINIALKAIDNGSYGQCSLCKKAIERGRLEIMPYADICASCNKI
jgi:RNA polymerase-binding transcription factor DksA